MNKETTPVDARVDGRSTPYDDGVMAERYASKTFDTMKTKTFDTISTSATEQADAAALASSAAQGRNTPYGPVGFARPTTLADYPTGGPGPIPNDTSPGHHTNT